MSLNRYAKRRDANEPAIIEALKAAGCDVERGDKVDLYVGRANRSWLLEVKLPGYTESDLKPFQRRMRDRWSGHYTIVTSAQEALQAVGLVDER